MELIVIGDGKIKLMLTREDMKHYALDKAADSESRETKRAIRDLLSDIKPRSGFDAEGERLLVQLYPSRSGGCELFVTKLGKPDAGERSLSVLDLRPVLYAFPALPPLLAVLRQLDTLSFTGASSVYSGDDGRWFLLLDESQRREPSPLSFIEEFGERRRGAPELAYIKEHAEPVAIGDAVKQLARFA